MGRRAMSEGCVGTPATLSGTGMDARSPASYEIRMPSKQLQRSSHTLISSLPPGAGGQGALQLLEVELGNGGEQVEVEPQPQDKELG